VINQYLIFNLNFNKKYQHPVKEESSSTSISNNSPSVLNSFPKMSENDDILELEALRLKQLQLEEKFLSKIPSLKSSQLSDVEEFLSQVNDIFNKLQYLDDSLKPWFLNVQKQCIYIIIIKKH
jgi:hypothetical protein